MATQTPNRQPMSGKRMANRDSNVESQGGGFRGGPKRWTGRGPPPARHIPWPEIFKHHISLVEGHRKMIEMVRKHTVPGTGNYRTIDQMVGRASEMLVMSKQLERSFLPPPNQREQVPLGVASDSMYPGYSPADHEYGKAAEEYGKAVAEARRRGVEIPQHPDIDYQIGQGKGLKRKSLAQMRELGASKEQHSGSGSGAGSGEDEGPVKKRKTNGHFTPAEVKTEEIAAKKADAPLDNDNPYFVIDTNPTPVNLPDSVSSFSKREAHTEAGTDKKTKKAKIKHSDNMSTELAKPEETDDISAKVDARMKEKEQKRKNKELKKRRRESEKNDVAATGTGKDGTITTTGESEKPNKKKKKVKGTEGGDELADRTIEWKRTYDGADGEGKRKNCKKVGKKALVG